MHVFINTPQYFIKNEDQVYYATQLCGASDACISLAFKPKSTLLHLGL
jgi:hypothetical protein